MKTDLSVEFIQDPQHLIRLDNIKKFDDGSGYFALLTVQSECFGCKGHHFYFDGLTSFHKQIVRLNEKLKGMASIGPTLDNEFIQFEATSLGHIVVRGKLYIYSEHPHRFEFSFETDQTYLPSFIESLGKSLNALEAT